MRIASEILARLYCSVTLLATIGNAQSTVHQQIQQTYNFQPHTLSNAEITKKSGVLDQFWPKAKSEPDAYVPALR